MQAQGTSQVEVAPEWNELTAVQQVAALMALTHWIVGDLDHHWPAIALTVSDAAETLSIRSSPIPWNALSQVEVAAYLRQVQEWARTTQGCRAQELRRLAATCKEVIQFMNETEVAEGRR